MSFVKVKDKWKRRIVFGVGTVLPNTNGEILNVSEPSSVKGSRRITFKLNGATRKLEDETWQRQLMNFGIWENSPLRAIVSALQEKDSVFVYGVLDKSKYISQTTGKQRNYYEVKLEYIQPIGRMDDLGVTIDYIPQTAKTEYDPDEDIPF